MAGFAGYPAILYQHIAAKRSRDLTILKWNTMGDELAATHAALGVNPHYGHATVAARLLTIEASLANLQGAMIDLQAFNNATTPNTKIDVACALLAIEGQLVSAVAVTIDATTTGAGGRQADLSLVVGWWYVWVGYNPTTGVVAGLISTTSVRGSLNPPSGYTKWRRVGAAYYTGSVFYRFVQVGCEVHYEYEAGGVNAVMPAVHTCHSNIIAGSIFVPNSLAVHLPPTARKAWVQAALQQTPSGSSGRIFRAMKFGGAALGGIAIGHDDNQVSALRRGMVWVTVGTDAKFYVGWNATPHPSASMAIDILGFYDPVG